LRRSDLTSRRELKQAMIKTDKDTLVQYKDKIVEFIRQYTLESGQTSGVVGLSGGVDSSLTYSLTCEALGESNTIGVIMPYKTSKKRFEENAKALAELKGGMLKYYDITDVVDSFKKQFDNPTSIRLGNIMARVRMITLYDTAYQFNGLVMGTGNKTEILLGYFTVYGDGGCSIEPLGDLYKTQVWEMAKIVGVPYEIINETPTADLWTGQSDEKELGITYTRADAVLYLLFEKCFTREEAIAEGYTAKEIDRVIDLAKKSYFKRHTPPAPRLRTPSTSKYL
jgi:NAD+ synthase